MEQAGFAQRVMSFAGPSSSGMTTLIEAMLPVFAARGLRVNVIKHSHHDVALEPPGKDSARFRAAGAQEVMIASPFRFAIVHELPIAMIIFSRVLRRGVNRTLQWIAAGITALYVTAGGSATPHYIFFALAEVICLVWIVIRAKNWRLEAA